MDQDLVEEIEYMEELLTKSGFFSADEMLEIMEDQFMDEDIDFSKVNVSPADFLLHTLQDLVPLVVM